MQTADVINAKNNKLQCRVENCNIKNALESGSINRQAGTPWAAMIAGKSRGAA